MIDSGINAAHEDLAGKSLEPCYSALSGAGTLATGCADDHGHGTHVSATIAASANNGKGIAGAAPNAKLYMCKALGADGTGTVADLVACMNEIVCQARHLRDPRSLHKPRRRGHLGDRAGSGRQRMEQRRARRRRRGQRRRYDRHLPRRLCERCLGGRHRSQRRARVLPERHASYPPLLTVESTAAPGALSSTASSTPRTFCP